LNGEYTTDHLGAPNKAYKFNGVDNFITIPNSASLNPTDAVTIAFWFKVDTTLWDVSQLVSKTVDDVEDQREYAVELKANFQYPYFKFWVAPKTPGVWVLGGNSLVKQWHLFVGVVDRKISHSAKLYIDGALVGSFPDNFTGLVPNAHPLYIGAGEGTWEMTSVPSCSMDDLRIYNRALVGVEIFGLYVGSDFPVVPAPSLTIYGQVALGLLIIAAAMWMVRRKRLAVKA
jgi:hypothetical protein